MATRHRGRGRGGWRDTDVWLDPDEIDWFGKGARGVAAGPVVPLLAGADGAAIAWPEPVGLPDRALAPPVRRAAAGPSRGRRLATRLLPTVASLAAAAIGVPTLLALRAEGPALAGAAAAFPAPPAAVPPAATPSLRFPDAAPPAAPAGAAAAPAPAAEEGPVAVTPVAAAEPALPPIRWRASRAVGVPHAGRLEAGVALPVEGPGWVTWDPVLDRVPNRAGRLFGTDALVRVALDVIEEYRLAHPKAPPVLIGDLSLRRGGEIDEHVSHENGLDVDVYFPRRDRKLLPPRTVAQVDLRLAQDLVDRFVAHGAQIVFVGLSTPLSGPGGVVVPYPGHDNHLHVRIPPPSR